MKRTIAAILILGSIFSSCTEKQQILTKKDIQREVDSLTKLKVAEINEQAQEDLSYRAAIEVKAKADSIVASKQPHAHKDTVQTQAPGQKQKQEMEQHRKSVFDMMHRLRH